MTTPPLTAAAHRPPTPLTIAGAFALAPGRAHEFCGPARQAMALAAAAAMEAAGRPGPLVWITAEWQAGRLAGEGVSRWVDPGRLLLVTPQRAPDLLWCLEEVLRSGTAPLVIADLPGPPGLTPVRRLHLAAEAGAELAGGRAPLALLLTPGEGGAPGIESRWHAAPAHGREVTRWHLSRRRARMAPPAEWHLVQPAPRAPLALAPLPEEKAA